jgi:hypothetical protein
MIKKSNKKEIKKIKSKFKSMIEKAKNANQIGKYGIVGNSGLGIGGFLHVSMPYDSNGKVFIKYTYKHKFTDGNIEEFDSWKRVDINKAKEKDIIKCFFCEKPAVRLDHLWPYYCEMNSCEEHLDEFKKHLKDKELIGKDHGCKI